MSDDLRGEPVDSLAIPEPAVGFLLSEHRLIAEGFNLYLIEPPAARWSDSIAGTLYRLKVHMELEEELFYPGYFTAILDDAHYHESLVEHEVLKKLIADIEQSDPADHQYRSMVRVLWKMTAPHFAEEERVGAMLNSSGSGSAVLVDRLERRRAELSQGMVSSRLRRNLPPRGH